MVLLQAIYTLCGGTSMTLTEFIAILGGVAMLFTQMPTFHSLWYVPFYLLPVPSKCHTMSQKLTEFLVH